MIIQCARCGYITNVRHSGTPEEIEQSVHETIQKGWRRAKNFDGYVCPYCSDGHDPLYEAVCGKIKKHSKNESYKALLFDVCSLIKHLKELDYD